MSGDRIVHDLLENFVAIGFGGRTALVSREPHCEHFAEDIRAAAVASQMGVSIAHAKRYYCNNEHKVETETRAIDDAYINAYHFAKSYVRDRIASLNTEGKPEPSAGELTASVALERLPYSFFCAHLMYQLGHRYEGHAISRLILEQLAWAYAAQEAQDIEIIKKIRTTKTLSRLTPFAPQAGKLYGFLSANTHIDYHIHPEFLRINNNRTAIIHAHGPYILPECGAVILLLGDLFGLVYQASQFQYIVSPLAVERRQGTLLPKPGRAYLTEMQQYVRNIDQAVQKAYEVPNAESGEASPALRIFKEWFAPEITDP